MPLRLSGSTGVSGIDGTAQAPAVQGTNPNAGIYYSGNNVIVSTSGNTALTVGPSGNVAISNSFSISGQYVSAYSGMMKNRVINGDMRIDQRFAGTANNNINGGQFVIDRWVIWGSAAAKVRLQQNNTNGPGSSATLSATGFGNYFGANTVSAATIGSTDYYQIGHYIEGYNIADLGWGTAAASPVTLSFWVYSSTSGMHSGSIANWNGSVNYAFPISVSAANTWEYKTVTIPGNTSSGAWFSNSSIGMIIYYNLGIGSTYSGSGNTWSTAQAITGTVQPAALANGAFYITGVQLEKGSQATAWEFRHYTTELQLCQRYYTVFDSIYLPYFGNGANGLSFTLPIKVSMRAAPIGKFTDDGSTLNAPTPIIQGTSGENPRIATSGGVPTANFGRFAGSVTLSAELGVTN